MMEGRIFGVMVFVFPSNHYTLWGPALPEMAEHIPAHGINSFVCSACACNFCFPQANIFISIYSFSSFCSSSFLPDPTGGGSE